MMKSKSKIKKSLRRGETLPYIFIKVRPYYFSMKTKHQKAFRHGNLGLHSYNSWNFDFVLAFFIAKNMNTER